VTNRSLMVRSVVVVVPRRPPTPYLAPRLKKIIKLYLIPLLRVHGPLSEPAYYYCSCCHLLLLLLLLLLLFDMDVSCHRPFLPGNSLEPAVIPTVQD